jgi:hypothetical protein
MTYSALKYIHLTNGGGYYNPAQRRVTYDGNTIHMPGRVGERRDDWVLNRPLDGVDNYVEGFADTINLTAESQRKYIDALSYSDAHGAHLEREKLLNKVATKSKALIKVLDSDTKVARVAEGAGKALGGAGTAASVLASAPVHAALGPFAVISIPVHAAVVLSGAGAVAKGGGKAIRAATRSTVKNFHEDFRNLKHEYARTADTAKQDRQSNGGLLKACGDQTAHTHLQNTMADVDLRITELLEAYQRVQPGFANEVYQKAGVPIHSDLAFCARAEEHLFKLRNLSKEQYAPPDDKDYPGRAFYYRHNTDADGSTTPHWVEAAQYAPPNHKDYPGREFYIKHNADGSTTSTWAKEEYASSDDDEYPGRAFYQRHHTDGSITGEWVEKEEYASSDDDEYPGRAFYKRHNADGSTATTWAKAEYGSSDDEYPGRAYYQRHHRNGKITGEWVRDDSSDEDDTSDEDSSSAETESIAESYYSDTKRYASDDDKYPGRTYRNHHHADGSITPQWSRMKYASPDNKYPGRAFYRCHNADGSTTPKWVEKNRYGSHNSDYPGREFYKRHHADGSITKEWVLEDSSDDDSS